MLSWSSPRRAPASRRPTTWSALHAFHLKAKDAFVLHRGTWHWGPFPVTADEVTLYNVQGLRYAEDNESLRPGHHPANHRGIPAGLRGPPRQAEQERRMDVRNISDIAPVAEHNGTTPVWYMFPPGSMRDITNGGSLELINEFEIIGGGAVDPHTHPTHEFYYVLYGKGLMIIDGEERDVSQGDLVYIPPNKVHSLVASSPHSPIRCFCFAVAEPGAGDINYTEH